MFHVSQEYPPHYGVFSIMEYVQILHHFKLWSSNIDIIVLYWALSSVCFVNTTSPSMNISMFNNIDPFLDKPARLTSTVLWFLFLIVKFVKSEFKKQIGRRWHCLGSISDVKLNSPRCHLQTRHHSPTSTKFSKLASHRSGQGKPVSQIMIMASGSSQLPWKYSKLEWA